MLDVSSWDNLPITVTGDNGVDTRGKSVVEHKRLYILTSIDYGDNPQLTITHAASRKTHRVATKTVRVKDKVTPKLIFRTSRNAIYFYEVTQEVLYQAGEGE